MSMVANVGSNATGTVFSDADYVFVDPEAGPTIAELAQQESDRMAANNQRANNIAKSILIPIAFLVLGPAQTLTRLVTVAAGTAVFSEAINARFPVLPKT